MARDTRFRTWDWSLAAHEILEILEFLVVSRHDQNSPGTTRKLLWFLASSPRWSNLSSSSPSSFIRKLSVFHGFSHHFPCFPIYQSFFNRVQPVSPKLCWGLPMTVAVLAQAGTHDITWFLVSNWLYADICCPYIVYHHNPSYTNILCIHVDICAYICHMSVYIYIIRVYIDT